jgi:hypothetical protein
MHFVTVYGQYIKLCFHVRAAMATTPTQREINNGVESAVFLAKHITKTFIPV